MNALIVEDDPAQSELGAVMLEEFDLEVGQVTSAEAAIDYLCERSGHVTVVLADINLAGEMDGLTLAHRLSVLWPAVSVIITSGGPLVPDADMPAHACFIPKPWRALDIVAVAERAARADHSVRAVQF